MGKGSVPTSPADIAQSGLLDWNKEQLTNVWNRFGLPEMERWAQARQEMTGIRKGFLEALSPGSQASTPQAQTQSLAKVSTSAPANPASETSKTSGVQGYQAPATSGGVSLASVTPAATTSAGHEGTSTTQDKGQTPATPTPSPAPLPAGTYDYSRLANFKGADHETYTDLTNLASLRAHTYDADWWGKNGAIIQAFARQDPDFAAYLNAVDPTMAERYGVRNYDMQVSDYSLDPTLYGFGQTTAAPELRQSAIDWQSQPELRQTVAGFNGAIDPAQYNGTTFLPLQQYVSQIGLGQDPAAVADSYAKAVTQAKLLDQDKRLHSSASAAGAGLAMRGLGGSSMAGSSAAALANMAARERAQIDSDTAMQRIQLTDSLNQARNAAVGQRASLGQSITAAENARRLQEGEFARANLNDQRGDYWQQQQMQQGLDEANLANWYNRQQMQQAWDTQANQNATQTALWNKQEDLKRQTDMMNALNFLQSDMPFALDPYAAVNAGTGIAQGYGSLAQADAQRWAAKQQANSQMWSAVLGAVGMGLGGL